MALSLSHAGTADPIEGEYFTRQSDEDSLLIRVHLDTLDGIARDVAEGLRSIPRRWRVEVGGLLLGHVEPGERPRVWIERYQRLECQHRFGPQFALDEGDIAALEQAAAAIYQSSDLNIVGFYRSHTHFGFQLEESDFELIGRYFSDPGNLILLIKPETPEHITAQFFARDASGEVQPSGPAFPFRGRPAFPFRGRVVGPLAGDLPADPADDPEWTAKTTGKDGPAAVMPAPDPPKPDMGGLDMPLPDPVRERPASNPGANALPLISPRTISH